MAAALMGHRRLATLAQIVARREVVEEAGMVGRDTAEPSAGDRRVPFKLSIPAIIGIVCVGLILFGLVALLWRWRMRARQIARMNRQFRASYEKYGIGRGIESSNSSGSAKSKLDPYGSFFEVETEKPKKALLNFRRASSSNTSHGHGGGVPLSAKTQIAATASSPPGWSAASTFAPPSVFPAKKKTPSPSTAASAWGQSGVYTQKPGAVVPSAASPPGLKGAGSRRSSFAFSLRKSEDKKSPKVQHLPTSAIKSKGISTPQLIVANGPAEPWSPLPTPDPPSTSIAGAAKAAAADAIAASSGSLPQPPPPVALQPQKFRQPQPRSPPATPGTSQKLKQGPDMLSPANYVPTVFGGHSDGSLYSRNSFSSSDHDHYSALQQLQLQLPEYTAAATALPTSSIVASSTSTSMSTPRTSGGVTTSQASMAVSGQQRGKAGKGVHNPYPSSSYTYSPQQSDSQEIVRPGSANSQYRNGSVDHLPRLMTVIAPFTPTLEDELALKIGDTVRVIEEYRDAWCMVQLVGRIDSPRGVVPCVCLQERKRIVPVPVNVGGPTAQHKSDTSLNSSSQWR